MMVQDKILDALRRGGPQVSPKIAREIKQDPLITSAYLSELSSSGKVKISKMKIGTSPLYYLPGQEKQLALFADRLNPKDRAVFDKLEQLKVLREAQLDLLSKVALRKMKDFAIPLQVSVGGQQEIFWKWYMLGPEDTNLIVSSLLQQVGPGDEVYEVPAENLSTPAVTQNATVYANPVNHNQNQINNGGNNLGVDMNSVNASVNQETSNLKNPWGADYPPNTTVKGDVAVDSVYPPNTATVNRGNVEFDDSVYAETIEVVNTSDVDTFSTSDSLEQTPEEIQVEQEIVPEESENLDDEEELIEEIEEELKDDVQEKLISNNSVKKDYKEDVTEDFEEIDETKKAKEKQKSLVEKLKDKILPNKKGNIGNLLPQVEEFFSAKKIKILSSEVVRKNSDISLQILVPSQVGKVLFFCKVRQKKRCDEKDISAAYMEAQVLKLPMLFLYTDEINAKAQEFLESDSFDNLLLLKLE